MKVEGGLKRVQGLSKSLNVEWDLVVVMVVTVVVVVVVDSGEIVLKILNIHIMLNDTWV